jgi:diguanylate cyclase (GGDEF)-like protein
VTSVLSARAKRSGDVAPPSAPRPEPGRGADAVWARKAWLVGAAGSAGLGLYLISPVTLLLPLFLVIASGSITAVVLGTRHHLPSAERGPWRALTGALSAFLLGAILRAVLPGALATPPGPVALVPDLLIVPGYLMLGYSFLDLLRRRRAAADDAARIDAVLMGLGAAFATWTFFIAPRVGSRETLTVPELVAAFFPVIDVLLLVLVLQLLLTGGGRRASMWLIGAACSVMFVADLLFAVQEGDSLGLDERSFDVLFMVSYVCLAIAALHPSMRGLTKAQRTITEDLRPARMVGIAAVLIAPAVLATLSPPSTVWNGVVRIALSVLLTLAVLIRIVRANNSRARAEQDARRRATHDPLTDLPNRELLATTVTGWCDRATDARQEISLLFIDLDRFKMVNDHWGHEVGDELLCAVAGRLGGMVRSEDLVCRIGGDEFVIALASPSHTRLAESLAERLIAEFAEPFTLSVGNVVITPSIGVALSEGAGEALELIRDADTAMYKAKGSGRNKYAMFDTSLRDLLHTRVRLEQALRGALERGELAVFYQPIIDLETDELTGFEALMRWNSPQLGAVSPLDFIPIAEETGLIERSGAWLLEEAAGQLVTWSAERLDNARSLHMSVNVSVRQLRDARLIETVRDVLARTGLPAEALWLEITESGVMEDLEVALITLRGLRELGVTMSIDDFGTGYSSLSYLNRLPVGILKIDRSFINGVGEDGANEPIVRAVLAMAHAMGHQVVAEGVETAVQRDWLRTLGCDLAQGYLYGAPRPAGALTDWIHRSSAEAQMGTRVLAGDPGAP